VGVKRGSFVPPHLYPFSGGVPVSSEMSVLLWPVCQRGAVVAEGEGRPFFSVPLSRRDWEISSSRQAACHMAGHHVSGEGWL